MFELHDYQVDATADNRPALETLSHSQGSISQVRPRAVPQRWTRPPLPAGATKDPDAAERDAATEELDDPLDRAALEAIREFGHPGGPDILQQIIVLYLEDSPKRLDGLRSGLNGNDARAVELAAHTLKSTSANLGARKLADDCFKLETMGRKKNLDGSLAVLRRVERGFNQVRTALRSFVPMAGIEMPTGSMNG